MHRMIALLVAAALIVGSASYAAPGSTAQRKAGGTAAVRQNQGGSVQKKAGKRAAVSNSSGATGSASGPKPKANAPKSAANRNAGVSNARRDGAGGASASAPVHGGSAPVLATEEAEPAAPAVGQQQDTTPAIPSVNELKCRDYYVSCMDAQIKDIVSHYTYLADDEAAQASIARKDSPFRCLYYDKNASVLTAGMKAVSGCDAADAEANGRDCVARDVNDLYYSYNYYCEIARSSQNNKLGRLTNYCELKAEKSGSTGRDGMSDIFAVPNSISYYMEASRRVGEGSLKMVNFMNSNLYKNQLANAGLDSLRAFDISSLMKKETKCPSYTEGIPGIVYKYDGSVQACRKYDTATNHFVDADVVAAELADRDMAAAATDAGSGCHEESYPIPDIPADCWVDSAAKSAIADAKKNDPRCSPIYNEKRCYKCIGGDYKYNPVVQACQRVMRKGEHDNDVMEAEKYYLKAAAAAVSNTAQPAEKQLAEDLKVRWQTMKEKYEAIDNAITDTTSYDPFMFAYAEEYGTDEKSPRDIFADLGLSRADSLFSINVVPPITAGNMFPDALFKKASEYCLSGTTKKFYKGSNTTELRNFNTSQTYLKNCFDNNYRPVLERYYLAGYWHKKNVARAEDGDYAEGDLEATDFFSARLSCDFYEKNLISVRDRAYGMFDTYIKNYLEDEVAQLIRNKTADLTKISDMALALTQDDLERTKEQIGLSLKRLKAETEKKMKELQARQELQGDLQAATQEFFEAQQKAMAEVAIKNGEAITNVCAGFLAQKLYNQEIDSPAQALPALGDKMVEASLNVVRPDAASMDVDSADGFFKFACTDFPQSSYNNYLFPAINALNAADGGG